MQPLSQRLPRCRSAHSPPPGQPWPGLLAACVSQRSRPAAAGALLAMGERSAKTLAPCCNTQRPCPRPNSSSSLHPTSSTDSLVDWARAKEMDSFMRCASTILVGSVIRSFCSHCGEGGGGRGGQCEDGSMKAGSLHGSLYVCCPKKDRTAAKAAAVGAGAPTPQTARARRRRAAPRRARLDAGLAVGHVAEGKGVALHARPRQLALLVPAAGGGGGMIEREGSVAEPRNDNLRWRRVSSRP